MFMSEQETQNVLLLLTTWLVGQFLHPRHHREQQKNWKTGIINNLSTTCICKAVPWPGCFGQPVINKDNAPVKHNVTSCNCIISLKILTQYIKYSFTVEDVYFSFSRLCLYTFRLTWISSKSNINNSVPLWWHSSADSSIDTNNISHYGVHAPRIKSRTKTWL